MVLLVVSVHDMVGCVLYVNQNEGWMDGSLCVLTVLLFVVVIASRRCTASELGWRGSIVVEPPLPSTF